MEFLSLLPLIISIISFIYKKVSENDDYYSSSSSQFYGVAEREQLTNDEFYESLQTENLTLCYATNKAINFDFNKALEIIYNSNSNFKISNAIRKKNVMYIKVEYGIPYNSQIKDFVTTFSINYIQANQNVIIYGNTSLSINQKFVFEQIAHDLIHEIAK